MKKRSKTYVVPHRRRREKKTNYKKRLALLKSKKLRLVVRKSSQGIICQIIKHSPKGDITLLHTDSTELKKSSGWKAHGGNISTAYLTGYLCGLKAKGKSINEAVLDGGLYISAKGSRIYAALKGVLDAGLKIPHSKEALPDDSRVSGKHVEGYAIKLLREDNEKYKKIFSAYIKSGLKPEEFSKHFAETKVKIKA